jgi:hypothetical protein
MDFMKTRQHVMENYNCNTKQFIDEFNEAAKLNEDILSKGPYASRMNTDNYPTHKYTDPQTGEEREYCAASKQWSKVDPACPDNKSLHYAGEDRIFLIVKNKFTGEWEFPVTKLMVGESFFKGNLENFIRLTNNTWKIKFFGSKPLLHTLREFTPIERLDWKNDHLHGVRTYYFGAHHWRGIPNILTSDLDDPQSDLNPNHYSDWCWVPKRKLNKYFSRENYETFIHMMKTR